MVSRHGDVNRSVRARAVVFCRKTRGSFSTTNAMTGVVISDAPVLATSNLRNNLITNLPMGLLGGASPMMTLYVLQYL